MASIFFCSLKYKDIYSRFHQVDLKLDFLNSQQYSHEGIQGADSKLIGSLNFEWSWLCACLGNMIAGFRDG